jgi:hypothetical protein
LKLNPPFTIFVTMGAIRIINIDNAGRAREGEMTTPGPRRSAGSHLDFPVVSAELPEDHQLNLCFTILTAVSSDVHKAQRDIACRSIGGTRDLEVKRAKFPLTMQSCARQIFFASYLELSMRGPRHLS